MFFLSIFNETLIILLKKTLLHYFSLLYRAYVKIWKYEQKSVIRKFSFILNLYLS